MAAALMRDMFCSSNSASPPPPTTTCLLPSQVKPRWLTRTRPRRRPAGLGSLVIGFPAGRAAPWPRSVDVLAPLELLEVQPDGLRVDRVALRDLALRLRERIEGRLEVADGGIAPGKPVVHRPDVGMELGVQL